MAEETILKEIMESKDPTIVSEGEDARAARCRPSCCDASWAPGIYWEDWKTRQMDKIFATLVGQYLLQWLGGTWGARGACCVTVSPPRNSVIIQHQTLENLEQLINKQRSFTLCLLVITLPLKSTLVAHHGVGESVNVHSKYSTPWLLIWLFEVGFCNTREKMVKP